ncbi:MAG: protein jag [Chloroflexi bacterium]|nr:MAG: protein jag [Chloroflexota bacterium]MBL1195319.1 protein jag [Chloroflexota bacterium]NOH12603.1 protein jag [Chloroflexota bacterium]
MDEHRATLEKIAPSIEEAIAEGLEELGLTEDQVEIEVLDEGQTGLFGIGNRQARVRIAVKEEGADDEPQQRRRQPREASPLDDDVDNTLEIARATVAELLERMDINAEVDAHMGEADDDDRHEAPIIVDVNGSDLSILIGRRAETLNALQYITRLIVGKELGRSTHLIVDVEGYRMRRERSLRQMAQKMARQAVRSGRRQSLEPMSPAERRIIHIELRDNADVYTESEGEDPRRKVVIIPN